MLNSEYQRGLEAAAQECDRIVARITGNSQMAHTQRAIASGAAAAIRGLTPQPDWEEEDTRRALDVMAREGMVSGDSVEVPQPAKWGAFSCGICGDLTKPCQHFIHNHAKLADCSPNCPLWEPATPPTPQPTKKWMHLPNEQTWWWHWNGEDLAIPHIYSVMVSKTLNDRYFIAYPDSRWCDELGGFWLKVQYPNVPSRTEQKSLAGVEQPTPKEAKWISVEVQMPEYDTDVILGSAAWPRVYLGYWRHSEEWIGRYRAEDREGPLPDTNPTHWQPLPAPPSGLSQKESK